MKRTFVMEVGSPNLSGLIHSMELGMPFMLDGQPWDVTDAKREGNFIRFFLEGETIRGLFNDIGKDTDLRL